jgi:MFS family permease
VDGGATAARTSDAPARHALAHASFRALIIAATLSYLGSFVQEVGQSWLMVELTKSAKPVAGLAALYTLPIVLFMIPAGVLADRWDRRKLLIASQIAQTVVALALAALAAAHMITPGVLLAAAFALGAGAALTGPPWQSLVPELVPRSQVAEAVTLGALSFNLARAVGPAIGGVVLAWKGPAAAFLVNGVSFLGVVAVLWWNDGIRAASERVREGAKEESVTKAVLAGVSFTLRSRPLRSCTLAVAVFAPAAAGISAILPVFARDALLAGARGYGSLVAALGAGAVFGAFLVRPARARLPARALVASAMTLFCLACLAMSRAHALSFACAAFALAGIGWISTFSTLAALVQTTAPDALKSRVVSLYGLVFIGAWVVGAAAGGALADAVGPAKAVIVFSIAGLVAALLVSRLPLPELPRPKT